MRLDDHFGSSSTVQRNERVKLAVVLNSIASNILTYLHALPNERH
jgi:hypothetical protein